MVSALLLKETKCPKQAQLQCIFASFGLCQNCTCQFLQTERLFLVLHNFYIDSLSLLYSAEKVILIEWHIKTEVCHVCCILFLLLNLTIYDCFYFINNLKFGDFIKILP